jgi:hypothetical protein
MKHLTILALTCAGLMAQIQPATINIYRPNTRIFGAGSHPSIYCDGQEVTRLHRGSMFSTEVAAGKHMITGGRSEVGQFLDVEPGKTYYLRFDFKAGRNWGGHEPFALTLIPERQALQEIHQLSRD